MMGISSKQRLRVPVRFVDGVWECVYGGMVPVAAGTEGELVIDAAAISDDAFLERMRSRAKFKVLDQGAKLLVWLTVKSDAPALAPDKSKHLIPYGDLKHSIATQFLGPWSPEGMCFVEVSLDTPNKRQAKSLDADRGGLWLLTEGPKANGLLSSQIRLPEGLTEKRATSLNHAYTLLSEIFEPWRISHTGNIYARVLYRAKNGRWYPLDLLRGAVLEKNDRTIADALWRDFIAKMTADPSAQRGL